MIYKFRLLSGENEEFFREIELQDSQNFLDFHKAIQQDCGYDPAEMASFHTCNDHWEIESEISLIDSNEPGSDDYIMETTIISSMVSELKQKLLYVFDIYQQRGFFIEMVEVLSESDQASYPNWVFAKGDPPVQFVEESGLLSFEESYSEEDDDFLDEFDGIGMENIDDFDDI